MEVDHSLVLSIVIPVYNVEGCLERCINSCLNQDIPSSQYEIILVDDGSTDKSYSICLKYSNRYPSIHCFTQKNQGQSVARNLGMKHAHGKYLAFVDSDDFIEPNTMGSIISLADKSNAELVFFRAQTYPRSVRQIGYGGFEPEKVFTGEQILLQGLCPSAIWGILYLRSFLEGSHVTFYPGIYSQDVEFCYRLFPLAKRVVFSTTMVYNYSLNIESTTHTINRSKKEKHMLDGLTVIESINSFANNRLLSGPLRNLYKRKMNSALFGDLVALVRDKSSYRAEFARSFISKAQGKGLYPIKGKTVSWKARILLPVFNNKTIFLLLVKAFAK